MPKSCVQFHATFGELCFLVDHISSQPGIGFAITILNRDVKTFRSIPVNDWKNSVSELSRWFARFWLYSSDTANSSGVIASPGDAAPGELNLNAGYTNRFGLSESALGYMTENVEIHREWAKLIRQVRKVTMTGVWRMHPKTNERLWYNGFRFTSGFFSGRMPEEITEKN